MLLGASARSKLALGSRAAVAFATKPAQVPGGSRGLLKIPVNAAAVVVALVSPLCMASTAMIRATAAAAATAATIRSTAIRVV